MAIAKNSDNSAQSLLDSNETDGLIGIYVIWSHYILFVIRYTVEVWETSS